MSRQAVILGLGAVALIVWWRQSATAAASKPVVNVNDAPKVTVEDNAAKELKNLAEILANNPDQRTHFDFSGRGVDVSFTSIPTLGPLVYYRIGGQPQIIVP